MHTLLSLLVAAAMAAGCGLKGPLYHPTEKPAAKKAVPPAPSAPAPGIESSS